MPNILIYTSTDDVDSSLVGKALEERGNNVYLLTPKQFPESMTIEIEFHDDSGRCLLSSANDKMYCEKIDSVWFYRQSGYGAPSYISENDAKFSGAQVRDSVSALKHFLSDAFWVNEFVPARLSESKVLQLKLAQRCRLRIPNTVITNCPSAIRSFLKRQTKSIYKPLMGYKWKEGEGVRATYTAVLHSHDLPTDRMLKSTPGIYQEYIEKQYEVRAQFFGKTCFSASIKPQCNSKQAIDWRHGYASGCIFEPTEVPMSVQACCLTLMQKLGIICGTFDFIVTPANEWVFLEVNQAGKFLFLEEECPELPLLDAFCQFLMSQDPEFVYSKKNTYMSVSEVLSD